MPKELRFTVSVLFLREGGGWVAQCLEYDIAAQGQTIPATKAAFVRTFCGQVIVDLHHGEEPLATFPPAPAEYLEKFMTAERLADRQPLLIPRQAIPPAYIIHAMADDLRISA